MYEYKAELIRVVDGDTVVLRVDLGFRMTFQDSFRLVGVDTPELRSSSPSERAAAKIAKEELEKLLTGEVFNPPTATVDQGAPELTIRTEKSDKYGRWLVRILVEAPKDEPLVTSFVSTGELSHYYEGVTEGGFRRTHVDASLWLIENSYGKPYDGGKR